MSESGDRPAPVLERIGSDIWWPEHAAGDRAREAVRTDTGRLGELAVWAAETQNAFPPRGYRRVRLVLADEEPTPAVATLADSFGIGPLTPRTDGTDVPDAIEAGLALADTEVESGTDLLVVAGTGGRVTAAGIVSALTGTEPVRAIPRGAAAADAETWMAHAVAVRDARLRINLRRGRADPLLNALGDPLTALLTGVLVGAASRRTPVLLDGPSAHAAALVAAIGRPAASAWWQAADSSPDPAVSLAQDKLRLVPLLGLGTATGDGTAGLLGVAVLRAAVAAVLGSADAD